MSGAKLALMLLFLDFKMTRTWKRLSRRDCRIKVSLRLGDDDLEKRDGTVFWERWHVCCYENRTRMAFVEPQEWSIWLRRGTCSGKVRGEQRSDARPLSLIPASMWGKGAPRRALAQSSM